MMKIFLLIIIAAPMMVMAKAATTFKSVDGTMRDPSQSLEGAGPSAQLDRYPNPGGSVKTQTRVEGCANCKADKADYLNDSRTLLQTAGTPTTIAPSGSKEADTEN